MSLIKYKRLNKDTFCGTNLRSYSPEMKITGALLSDNVLLVGVKRTAVPILCVFLGHFLILPLHSIMPTVHQRQVNKRTAKLSRRYKAAFGLPQL